MAGGCTSIMLLVSAKQAEVRFSRHWRHRNAVSADAHIRAN